MTRDETGKDKGVRTGDRPEGQARGTGQSDSRAGREKVEGRLERWVGVGVGETQARSKEYYAARFSTEAPNNKSLG